MTKKYTEKDDEEQSKRFVETAQQLKADKSGKAFVKAMETVAKESHKNKYSGK